MGGSSAGGGGVQGLREAAAFTTPGCEALAKVRMRGSAQRWSA